MMCTWDALNANVNLTKVGFDEKTQSKHDTLSHSICDIRTNNSVSKHNVQSTRKPTCSSVLDFWFMVRDGERCKRLAVHDSVGGGLGWLWLE